MRIFWRDSASQGFCTDVDFGLRRDFLSELSEFTGQVSKKIPPKIVDKNS